MSSTIEATKPPKIEFLLKQVYAAHKSVMKDLEAENRHLSKLNRTLQNELLEFKEKYNTLREKLDEINRSQLTIAQTKSPHKVSQDLPISIATCSTDSSPSNTLNLNITFVPETLFPEDHSYEDGASPCKKKKCSPSIIIGSPECARADKRSLRKLQSWSFQSMEPLSKQNETQRDATSKDGLGSPVYVTSDDEHADVTTTKGAGRASPTLSNGAFLFASPRSTKRLKVDDSKSLKSFKRIGEVPSSGVAKRNRKSDETLIDADDPSLDATIVPPQELAEYQQNCKGMDADFFDDPVEEKKLLGSKQHLGDQKIDQRIKEDNKKSSKDKIPYAYKHDPVRKRDEREKLDGHTCKSCMEYYTSIGLDEEEIKQRLKNSSRHRHKFAAPPSTPEHFWSPEFPSTIECKRLGYIPENTQQHPLKSRRYGNIDKDNSYLQ